MEPRRTSSPWCSCACYINKSVLILDTRASVNISPRWTRQWSAREEVLTKCDFSYLRRKKSGHVENTCPPAPSQRNELTDDRQRNNGKRRAPVLRHRALPDWATADFSSIHFKAVALILGDFRASPRNLKRSFVSRSITEKQSSINRHSDVLTINILIY